MNEDKGTRYRRLQRLLQLLEVMTAAAALTVLAASRVPSDVRATAAAAVASSSTRGPVDLHILLTGGAVLLICLGVPGLCAAPFAWRRQVWLARRYGVNADTTARWLRRHLRRGAVLLVAGSLVWGLFASSAGWSPVMAGVLTAVAVLAAAGVLMLAAPLVVAWSPHVRPIRNEILTGRLHALASRAGLRLSGLHEWMLGRGSDEANAAIIGVVGPRRLLLSDTLVETCPAEEVEAVVAHELGHHVHGHTWRRVRTQALCGCGALLAAQCAAVGPAVWVSTAGPTNAASIPWMLLAAGAAWIGTRPWRLTQSRAHEAEADAFAVALTDRPDVLERVLTRLGARSLSSEETSPFAQAFFLTHPPIAARIAAIRAQGSGLRTGRTRGV